MRHRKSIHPLWVAAMTTMSLFTVPEADAARASKPTIADGAVEAEVESELLLDPAVQLSKLEVAVDDGIVTLAGTAESLGVKDRATEIAGTVRGVRSIVNRIDVAPDPNLPGPELASRVDSALLRNPATESFEIDVSARSDGTVTLEGSVDSWREKNIARTVATHVDGVTGIRNELDIKIAAGRPDREIEDEVEQALKWDTLVNQSTIDVSVADGVVSLTGIVGSPAEASEAVYDAYVRGVRRVDESDLEVSAMGRERDQRRPSLEDVTDPGIKTAINDAMQWDPRVDEDDVDLRVKNGIVSLTGTVHSYAAKRAASGIARRTTGVLAVNDQLVVDPSDPRPDAAIESDLELAFVASPTVDADDVEFSIHDGVVKLTGQVASNYERMRASHLAEDVIGVRLVENELSVEQNEPLGHEPYTDTTYIYDYDWYDYEPTQTSLSDAEIAREIRDELWWSPFVDSEGIAIVVDDGIATLTGTVDSWSERESAAENAYEGGAIWVDNDLAVN